MSALLEWTADGLAVFGPITPEQLRQAATLGQISIAAYARPVGAMQWSPVGQLVAASSPDRRDTPILLSAQPCSLPQPGTLAQSAPAQATVGQLQDQVRELEAQIVAHRRELETVEEAIEIQAFGFYRPRYGFETSEKYTERLKAVREQQKAMVKANQATACGTNWVVGGSAIEGKRMIERMSKLMLRAFNAECDAAITKVKYDNVLNLEERITKSLREISKLGESNRIAITTQYLDLKLAELHLVHEHREKVQEEKEAQREAKEALREELRAQEEIDRAKAEAEEEEARYEKALAKAKADLIAAQGTKTEAQTAKLEALVDRLDRDLKEALDRKAKAIARAQLTRSGHVYVISNIGSFGPDIYKIGLTRRFEPLERVAELGTAAVPFPFDVHAIIYSEDAPALETALHREFANRRVNMVNARKEYFRITLDEIRAAVEKHFGLVTFVLTPEAEQWRKTEAIGAARVDQIVD